MPVLLDEAGGIIAGHGRVWRPRSSALTVPCMVANGWSDAQKRAYVIADNKIADNAIWDEICCGSNSRDSGVQFPSSA